jgi:hypothetical protein
MVKLPSINTIVGGAIATLKRFPMSMLCAFVATGMLIYLTHNEFRDHDLPYFYTMGKMLMCCELGLCLFLAFALVSEARQHSFLQKALWQCVALVLITVYFFTLGDLEKMDMIRMVRFFLYVITVHLFVAFAPFVGNGHINGFWQYNKTLFLRILLASLYTAVLYGGISLALWSINELLHISINYKKYLYVWYFLACIFNTSFFLAGLPENIKELDNDTSYLKGLKTFTQYVLLPLVSVYLLILYAYIARVIIEWKLPKGLVSYLVIGYSVAGIFSLLLIYPIRNNDENKWIKIFSRWFYFALYPLIILLCISIFNRIAEYGITENRYFILVIAIWLFCIASYFLMNKNENIKVIPISLAFIAFFSSFGPWGAFSVSEHSQMSHLQDILTKNKILVNGKIDEKNEHPVTSEESDEIYSVIEYLDNSSSLDIIAPWFPDVKLDSIKYGKTGVLVEKMKLFAGSGKDWNTVYYYANNNGRNNAINIKGFEYLSTFYASYNYRDTSETKDTVALGYFMLQADTFSVFPVHGTNMFTLKVHKKDMASLDFNKFLKQLHKDFDTTNYSKQSYKDFTIPNEKFTLDIETDSLQLRFLFKNVTTDENHDKIHIRQMDADVLIRKK